VEIECSDDGTLVVCVEDTGRQFDPTQVTPPVLAKSLAEAKVGHLGIHLVRRFASGMHYERRGDHNRLTLRFSAPQWERYEVPRVA
jgi:serine/threonine-protein kinase RsbW